MFTKNKTETVKKQCWHCGTVYEAPAAAGCVICPGCGQRSCSD